MSIQAGFRAGLNWEGRGYRVDELDHLDTGNDAAERLRVAPVMGHVVGGRTAERTAVSASERGHFEIDVLTEGGNLAALMDMPGRLGDAGRSGSRSTTDGGVGPGCRTAVHWCPSRIVPRGRGTKGAGAMMVVD